ncbi:MAG: helix-turn-helix transcriptional regulator [Chitinophagaceae bacterium]
MIRIEYNQTHYEKILKQYAAQFGTKIKDNAIFLPPNIGNGIIRVLSLSNGLQIFISNYTLKEDLLLYRKKSAKDFYLIRCEEITLPATITPNSKSAVFLSATNHDQMFLYPAGTSVKMLSALFDKNWLAEFFLPDEVGDTIKKFLSSTLNSFVYEPMDAEYRRFMQEMLQVNIDKSYEQLIIHNRIMLIMERFFTRLYFKITDAHFSIKLSDEEIIRMKEVENELLKDFSLPPAITQLARIAAMSPSKLQANFKEMFGMPVYQYFQKHRMNRAKAMLLSKNYSTKQVSEEVGFSTIKHFIKAFQKSFEQLPEDILQNFK